MRLDLSASLIASALKATAAALAFLLPSAPPVRADDGYQTMLERFVKGEGLPGGVLLVSSAQTRSVVATGIADRKTRIPIGVDSRFYVASIGKMAVAVATLQLVEDGVLALDAPVAPLAADLPGISALANLRSARLSQLLNHSSGIPDYLTDAFREASLSEPARFWVPADSLLFAFKEKASFKPGTSYEYSNSNYVLLGHIVATMDRTSLETSLRRRLFERAGMTGSSVGVEPGDRRLAHGYADTDEDGEPEDVSLMSWNCRLGDGPLVTTASDLERFLFALFRDGRLLKPATLSRMTARSPQEEGYGYGLELGEDEWGPWAGHTGTYDGFDAEARYYFDQQAVIVFLTNGNQESDDSLVDRAAARLFGSGKKRSSKR
jgi:D-alanyl-D-alanine carboxypeptidase